MILQAVIGGFRGQIAVVLADIDLETQTLYITGIGRLNEKSSSRFSDETGLISNQPLDDVDYVFEEKDFSQAFKDYRFFANSGRLIFEEATARATPTVEIEKITEKGTQLAIHGEITNEQLAVIALCFFARQTCNAQNAIAIYEDDQAFMDLVISI